MIKNILVICQHYYPENFQVTDVCEELVKRGYNVTALVGLPNYPHGYILDEYKHNKKREEFINGVHIIRCFEIGRRKGKLFLGLNYLSFWLSSVAKIKELDDDYDVVLGYETSPITMVDAGRVYCKKHKKPFYIWCCDIWPECLKVYIKSEKNIIYRFFNIVSKKIYKSAKTIFCSSKSFIDYLHDTHKIDFNNLEYLPQFGDDSLLKEDYTPSKNKIFDIVFMGNVGREQNLPKIIESLYEIKDLNYKLHIVGDGSDISNVETTITKLNMNEKVITHGRKPREEMPVFYKIADVCLVSLRSDNKIGYTLPNKIQNYLAAGKPIIGMISGSAKIVINDSNSGLCVDGNDMEGFSRIVFEMINNPNYNEYSINAKKYYMDNFTRDIVITKLCKMLENNKQEGVN